MPKLEQARLRIEEHGLEQVDLTLDGMQEAVSSIQFLNELLKLRGIFEFRFTAHLSHERHPPDIRRAA